MQDANPFQTALGDEPANLPIDPNTGVPIVNIGHGASPIPNLGGGGETPFGLLSPLEGPGTPDTLNTLPGPQVPMGGDVAPFPVPPSGNLGEPGQEPEEATGQFNDKSLPLWQRAGLLGPPTADQEAGFSGIAGQDQDQADHDLQVQIERSKLSEDPPWAENGPQDFVMPLNEGIINTIDALRGVTGAVQQGVDKVLGKIGLQALQSPQGWNQVSAASVFDALGLQHGYPKSYLGEGGQVVWDTVMQSLALYAGAAEMQAMEKTLATTPNLLRAGYGQINAGTSVLGTQLKVAAQQWAKSIMDNPVSHFITNELAAVGSVIGGNAGQRFVAQRGGNEVEGQVANLGGGLVGGLLGGVLPPTVQGVSKALYVGTGSRWLATKLTAAIGHFLDDVGAWRAVPKGMRPERATPMPTIPDDVLDAARKAESAARAASADVVSARWDRDMVRGTSREEQATNKLNDLQKVEELLNDEADKHWDKLPAAARGKYSREQTALRDQLSETAYPRAYADDQVTGDLALVDNELQDLMSSLSPEDKRLGVAGHSLKLSDGLWKLKALANGIIDKYWARAPLDENFTKRYPAVDALRNYRDELTASGKLPDDIPTDYINYLRDKFGNIKEKPPTLGFIKGVMTNLTRKAYEASKAHKTSLAGSIDGLKDVLQDIVSNEFPGNIELAQARRVTTEFHDMFSDSEVGNIMRFSSPYATATRKDEIINELMKPKGGNGVADVQKAIQWVQKQGMVNVDHLGPMDREIIQQTQNDLAQGIRAHIQQYASDRGQDPQAVARYLNDPVFSRQIASMGEEAAVIGREGQRLQGLVDRRNAIQKSALAKYMKSDPDRGIDLMWKDSTNPVAMAKMLLDGQAGIGGFRQDPIAMQGLQAGLLDRFYALSKGHYLQMKQILDGPKGRLMKYVMNADDFGRLNNMVEKIGDLEKEAVASRGHIEHLTLFHQYMALKGLHLATKIWGVGHLLEMGEGASLKRASLVSGFAKDWTEQSFAKLPPNEVFKEAISNPAFERMLFSKIPTGVAQAKQLRAVLRESTATEQAFTQVFRSWASWGTGPGPNGEGSKTDTPFSWLTPSSAQAGTVSQFPTANDKGLNTFNQLQPGGYAPPANAGAVGEGVMSGKVKILRPDQRSELEERGNSSPSRAVGVENYHYIEENRKNSLPGPMPGVIGPGDRVPDRERGQGPGKRVIRISEDGGKRSVVAEEHYPNPFSDIGKYTPTPLSKPQEPNPALKFWEHPSPKKTIPIREGRNPFRGAAA